MINLTPKLVPLETSRGTVHVKEWTGVELAHFKSLGKTDPTYDSSTDYVLSFFTDEAGNPLFKSVLEIPLAFLEELAKLFFAFHGLNAESKKNVVKIST